MSSWYNKKYDFFIIITIASLAWGAYELLGAITPIRLIGLYGLFMTYKNKKKIYKLTFGLSKLFYFWIIYSFISVGWSLTISSWAIQFCHTATMMGAIMALALWAEKSQNPLKAISNGWLLFIFLTMPIAIWELSTGNHLSSGSYNLDAMGEYAMLKPFAAATFANYNSYVVMLCIALPFIINILFNGSIKYRLLSVLALAFIFVVLAFNTSRGGILCFIIALSLFVCAIYSRINFLFKIVLILLLSYGVYYLIINIDDILIFEHLLRRSESTGLFEDSSRSEVWYRSILISAKYLFIGTGCGSMPGILDYYYPNQLSFCHNYFLETLLEYGLLIFFIWFISIFKIIVRNIKSIFIEIKYVGLYALMSAPFLLIIDDYYAQRTGIWLYIASLLVLYNYNKTSLGR